MALHTVSILLLLVSATPLPWNRGDVVWDGWKVTRVHRHAEFLRYRLVRRAENTVVEVTYKRTAKQSWSTQYFRVQPAPGFRPNYPLLRAMRRHLSTWEHKSDHRRLVAKRGFVRGGGYDWGGILTWAQAAKLALGLLLLCGLLLLPPVKRALRVLFVKWTQFATLLNPRADRFGPSWVGRRTFGDVAAAFAVFAATTTTLLLSSSPPPLYADTCVDLGLARDCVDGAGCYYRGGNSSFMGLYHGALWSHFLAGCRWLSWGPNTIHVAATTLHGIAFGSFTWILLGLVRRSTALLAATLLLVSAIAMVEYPVLWNPTIAPITSVLFFGSLVAMLRSGRLVHAVLLGICLALVADAHLIHFLYVPVALLAMGLVCRRPWLAVLLGCSACAGLLWVVSREAMLSNLVLLSAEGYLIPLAWAAAVSFLLGLAWREAYDTLEAPVLQFLFLAFASLLLMLVPVAAQRVAGGHSVMTRYFLPTIPMATLLLARLARHLPAERRLRRVSFVMVWAFALYSVLSLVRGIGPAKTYWSVAEVKAMAGSLHGRGYTYEMITRQLRGPERQNVVKCLGVFTPKKQNHARKSKPTDALYVTRFDWNAPPKRWAPGRELVWMGESSVVVLQRLTTWVDLGCKKPCTYSAVRPVSFYRRAKVGFRERPVREISYPVVIRGDDPARLVRIVGRDSPWHIVRVSGVRWSGKLPARQVRLLRSEHKTGTLTFRVVLNRPPTWDLPGFVELPGE